MSKIANETQGRVRTGLGLLQLEVVSKTEAVRYDPVTIIMAAVEDKLARGEPHYTSFLSGRPGFLYRNEELQIALTRDELIRFVCHNLRPDEFKKLYQALGSFYEIHDDFVRRVGAFH